MEKWLVLQKWWVVVLRCHDVKLWPLLLDNEHQGKPWAALAWWGNDAERTEAVLWQRLSKGAFPTW